MSSGLALISLAIGLVFIAIGGTATLSTFGVGVIEFPALVYSTLVTKYALLAGGILLMLDSIKIRSFHTMMPTVGTVLLGLILGVLGAFPLLMDYDMLDWLPFSIKFTIPDIVLTILLAFFGLVLLFNAYRLIRSSALFGR